MKSIEAFIHLGWYTVPLGGQLKRLEDGTKSQPKFKKGWKSFYQAHFNEKAATLGGALTGSISNIVALDCDSQEMFDMFVALDPDYSFHFLSLGKPKGGGTIIYSYAPDDVLPSFSIHDDMLNFDYYSDNGFVYLPSEDNKTKVNWAQETMSELPLLAAPPASVRLLLHTLNAQYVASKRGTAEGAAKVVTTHNHLGPQVELFVAKEVFVPQLFRVITPKDFRDLDQYIRLGFLHPSEVPEGRGSEYLSKISAILGADVSVPPSLYTKAINLINSMWASPLPASRLNSTIIEPMLSGSAAIAGDSIWQYDEHWCANSVVYTTKIGDAVEAFYDEGQMARYLVNMSTSKATAFYKDSEFLSHIGITAINAPPRKELLAMLPLVETVTRPGAPFGYTSSDLHDRQFNLFKQSPALAILAAPTKYAHLYRRPDITLAYFESLVPDERMRTYLLQFLKHKLKTFAYSPVVLYFLGRPGSGKDTLVALLEAIIGGAHVSRPTAKEFLEHYNSWMLGKFFVHLDEYGNQLARAHDKDEALGKLKAYSGKKIIDIRQMRTDSYSYEHSVTFIVTANSNPLLVEDNDRRVALLSTPNELKCQPWVDVHGGIQDVCDTIIGTANDFCYYLATEVKDMTSTEYTSPPSTDAKHTLILDMLSAGPKLAYIVKHDRIGDLQDLAEDYGLALQLFEHTENGKLYEAPLLELYQVMTDFAGTQQQLTRSFKAAGVQKVPTTLKGKKAYFYSMPSLRSLGTVVIPPGVSL